MFTPDYGPDHKYREVHILDSVMKDFYGVFPVNWYERKQYNIFKNSIRILLNLIHVSLHDFLHFFGGRGGGKRWTEERMDWWENFQSCSLYLHGFVMKLFQDEMLKKWGKLVIFYYLYSQLCRHEVVHLELIYELHQSLKTDSNDGQTTARTEKENRKRHA